MKVLVVCGPGHAAGGARYVILQYLAGFQVFYPQGINAPAKRILSVSQVPVVEAYVAAPHGIIIVGFRQLVHIEHDLLFRFQVFFLARVDGVFFSFFVAGKVVIAVVLEGYRLVVLLDPAYDLVEEFFLKIPGMGQDFVQVFVFGGQVADDLRVFPLV